MGKPYQNSVSSASNNRMYRNISRSQVDSSHAINVNRESISIDRDPISNKLITSSQNGGQLASHPTAGPAPIGSTPLAQAIYGHSSSNNNRNYRGNKSKHMEGKGSLQSKRSLANVASMGGGSSVQNSIEHQRMLAFKNNMREI